MARNRPHAEPLSSKQRDVFALSERQVPARGRGKPERRHATSLSRNQRTPTGPDTPHAIAASSLDQPAAIFTQSPRSTSRRTGGRPGDRIAARPVS